MLSRRPSDKTAQVAALALILLGSSLYTMAAVVPDRDDRFSDLILHDPVSRMGQLGDDPETTPGFEAERDRWRGFTADTGGRWSVRLDRRSGVPLLVRGSGILWFTDGEPVTVEALEQKARAFLQQNGLLLKVRESELVLLDEGSGAWDGDHQIVQFDRVVGGIPVENQRFRLMVSHGNLVAFGADRWGPTPAVPAAELIGDAAAARERLYEYMGLDESDVVEHLIEPRLHWIATPVPGETSRRFAGLVGRGVDHVLVWQFVVRVNDGVETWVGKVDAVDGDLHAFYDDTRYAQAKGGVFPVSNDGQCTDGCEQPNYPMPYLDLDIGGNPVTANDAGVFECTPAGNGATTQLSGPYVRVSDRCGAVNEAVTCDDDLDLQVSTGTDCVVPAGSSAGNTHAARSCYYHVNRLKEKARSWMPSIGWFDLQTVCDVNVNSNCNASYGGNEINMYTSGGGCGNTGEIGGVLHHEYGHGIDQNDGGGSDNSSEAYADVVAILQERVSCIGRGFYLTGTCGGYGDTCLTCSGIREHDWAARQRNTPATPANFTNTCGSGGGPCGKAVHCEAYVPSEVVFDLATRDLPAAGLDADSAWQLAERLWFSSRLGSGGNIFNCALPASDGCGAGNWFMEMMTMDDDDGNLANGTPHAGAIFAAFDRHAIACGSASDPENQDSGTCPSIDAPVLTASGGNSTVSLDWGDVAGAGEYRVLRTENGCGYSMNVVDTLTAPLTQYDDVDLPNGFDYYYRVQAVGANPACESAVSNCVQTEALALAGRVKFGAAEYRCTNTLDLQVDDANVGASTLDVTVWSDSETTPETVTLTETSPGSTRFTGSIQATTAPTVNGDGLLQVTHFDNLTAEYIDADDGEGGSGISNIATSFADCVDLVRTSLVLDDSVGGNGDGILEPGEWVDLPIELQNVGDDVARNVHVQVESLSPFVEARVIDSSLPDMPGGTLASTSAGNHLQVRVTTSLPCTDPVSLRFHYLADDESVTQDDTFPTGTKVTVDRDDFEGVTGWQHIAAESTATTGDWVVGDPDGTTYQPEDDTTVAPGVNALFTQPNAGGLGTDDVDDGVVVARSAGFDLSAFPDVRVSLNRWFANRDTGEDSGDFWRLEVRESDTSADVLLEELDTNQSAPQWTEVTFRLGDFITVSNQVSLKVSASDGPATGNLIEAAIDDVWFWDPTCQTHDPAPNTVTTLLVNRAGVDLDLSWQRPTLDPTHGETTRYRVYRSTAPDAGFSERQLVSDSGTGASWTDLGAGDTIPSRYFYLVVSENDAGTSEPAPAP
jgi:hypothetical protein